MNRKNNRRAFPRAPGRGFDVEPTFGYCFFFATKHSEETRGAELTTKSKVPELLVRQLPLDAPGTSKGNPEFKFVHQRPPKRKYYKTKRNRKAKKRRLCEEQLTASEISTFLPEIGQSTIPKAGHQHYNAGNLNQNGTENYLENSVRGRRSRRGKRRFPQNINPYFRQNNRNEQEVGDAPGPANPRYHYLKLGFKNLESIYEKEPDDIIVSLNNDKSGFSQLLWQQHLTNDLVVLILRVLVKMCGTRLAHNKAAVMKLAVADAYFNKLIQLVAMSPFQSKYDKRRNKYFWLEQNRFFRDVVLFGNAIIDAIPTSACQPLSRLLDAFNLVAPSLEARKQLNITQETRSQLDMLLKKVKQCKLEIEKKAQVINAYDNESEPEDDFRLIPVYPTPKDVLSIEPAFLRKNVIIGSYRDGLHYLDVQFRLLREDFVEPLREAICEFVTKGDRTRNHSVFVHRNVTFLSSQLVKGEIGYLIQLDVPKRRKGFLQNPRRFMYGCLLCFTTDNFATLTFAKVIDRKETLKDGQLVVQFDSKQTVDVKFDTRYTMIECNVYFEPYYHVLTALQIMDPDNIPMKKYVVDVEGAVSPPNYVNNNLSFTLDKTYKTTMLSADWPSAAQLSLDESQFVAFKSALTSELALIQGPPGTGKTFLGLKIAETILNNASELLKPILVVCFTNHALDQFLEGLIHVTDKIIRVGGQSKNEKLARFNIKEQRKQFVGKKGYQDLFWQKRQDERDIMKKIKSYNNDVENLNSTTTVVSFKQFRVIDQNIAGSWFENARSDELIEWLFGGETDQDAMVEQVPINEVPQEVIDEEVDAEMFDAINRTEHILDLFDSDPGDEVFGDTHIQCQPFLTLKSLMDEAAAIAKKIEKFPKTIDPQAVFHEKWEAEARFQWLTNRIGFFKKRMAGRRQGNDQKPQVDLRRPHHIKSIDRWQLYFYWANCYKQYINSQMLPLNRKYVALSQQIHELNAIESVDLMKQMKVVGMTTTGAARLQTSLQALNCPVVIVEEAAEVLESHIIVSLTPKCQHLILIGDHQQLRPSAACYKIEKKFNLGISFFERMILNDIPRSVLAVQHRMRPEIASLIAPTIYPKLENHESVLQYPPVLGIDRSVFFIDHNNAEADAMDSSKQNQHEVDMLLKLAQHLVLNGYKPEEITIIAAYSGQLFLFFRHRKNYDLLLKNVRITVLDNYQGEENRIILLSLVRNNGDNKIGFLKIENRVCVALSRAKEGFYIMGNMELLCRNSEIWPKIKDTLEAQGSLGHCLRLRCQIHQHITTDVKNPIDFNKIPEGGCNQMCEAPLQCGHVCSKLCHIRDRQHEMFKCKGSCKRILCDLGHKCPKLCYEDCDPCSVLLDHTLECGHQAKIECHMDVNEYKCNVFVSTKLPCDHRVNKPCHADKITFKCPEPCDTRIEPCGHSCVMSCHIRRDPDHLEYKCPKKCEKIKIGCSTNEHICGNWCYEECEPCEIIVKKARADCPHVYDIFCKKDVNAFKCSKPCVKKLPCGHKCKEACFEDCGICRIKVDKIVPTCGHKVKVECHKTPSKEDCQGRCQLKLACGHPCGDVCKNECNKKCEFLVPNNLAAACGHTFKFPCYLKTQSVDVANDESILRYCKEPCQKILKCGHKCSGSCGDCLQGRVHKMCMENCGAILICNHECKIPCREACRSCSERCQYSCVHSKCKKKCGEPCTRCVEPCPRRCEHQTCRNRCCEPCSVQSCKQPCKKLLRKCRHPCVGLCGDPCPPLCRICDKEELTEIIFGNEDEDDARFVLLVDCGHVVESEGMEQWLSGGSKEIGVKSCFKCKTPLTSTQRYSDYVKETFKDIAEIKKKYFGDVNKNENQRRQMLSKTLDTKKYLSGKASSLMLKICMNMETILCKPGLDEMTLKNCEGKLNIVIDVMGLFTQHLIAVKSEVAKIFWNYVDVTLRFLLSEDNRLTEQAILDMNAEFKRLNRMAQLLRIEQVGNVKTKPAIKKVYNDVKGRIFCLRVYTSEDDAHLEVQMKKLDRLCKTGVSLTPLERQQIKQALNLSAGHWFKCPNGHLYIITECGGAMQTGKCNECGAEIGGMSYRLLPNNQHTGEMDGSSHAAWSEQANMGNYNLGL